MIELPKSIRVGYAEVTVGIFPREVASAGNRMGEYDPRRCLIRIDDDQERSDLCNLDTLLHEIVHAIFHHYDLHDSDREEKLVTVIAGAWTQIYRDNPDLLRFIAASVKGANT